MATPSGMISQSPLRVCNVCEYHSIAAFVVEWFGKNLFDRQP